MDKEPTKEELQAVIDRQMNTITDLQKNMRKDQVMIRDLRELIVNQLLENKS